MKRIFAFFCALMLFLTSCPVTAVFAESIEFVEDSDLVEIKAVERELFPDLRLNSKRLFGSIPLENDLPNEFIDYLQTHFRNCETQFSIAEFNIPYSWLDDLRFVIWYEIPELFHVYSLGCNYNSSTNTIVDITAGYQSYADTAAEYEACLDKMLSGAEYLLQGVKNNNDLTNVEKALILHDRLAVWTEYDLEGADQMDPDSPIFGAYSALGEGLSVCQGYAMAYMYLLEQVGIESDLCSSNQLCHAWNIVYIDGVAYHVDVTWDDPVNGSSATYNDNYGRVEHDNFLLSSDGIWDTGHRAYDYNTAPRDTRYDSKNATTWWKNSNTAIQVIDNNLYYLDKSSGTVICADDGSQIHGHEYYYSSYNLSSVDGTLLCATTEDVHAVDPKTGASSVVYTPSTGYIEGMKYEQGKLWVQMNDGNGNSKRVSVDYEPTEDPFAADYEYTVENGEVTITKYTGIGSDVTIPATLDSYPVTSIGDYAFSNCAYISNVTIPDRVTTIGFAAFSNCERLKTVTIGNRVTQIGNKAFFNCGNLEEVTIPGNVTTIGYAAFSSCDRMTAVIISPGVISIGDEAFYDCVNLRAVTIPTTVTSIGAKAFGNCSLFAVEIPDSVTSLGNYAFVSCGSLETVTIGNGVSEIGAGVFDSCYKLKTVTIGTGVTFVGQSAFADCISLTDVYYGGTKAQWDNIKVSGNNDCLRGATIHCAAESHTHSYGREVTKPTCTTEGYTIYTCICGDTYKADYVDAKGHNYAAATCTAAKTCKICGKTSGNALGHNYAAATCTKPKTCKVCKATSGKALGHSYKSGSCTRCKYKPAGAKITTQPKNVAVGSGKTAKVTIKASGTGLKYTWYYAKKGSSKYTKTTVTSSNYSVKMSSSVSGRKVYCIVTDAYGNSVKSAVVTLYKGTAAKITTQPKSTTVANGKTGKLTIKASGSSLKYQWYIKYKGASSFTKVGKSSKTYSFKMASKLNGAEAYCVVKDKYDIEVKSSVVTVKMAPQPKITTQPKSAKSFSGKTVKFTVKATGEGLKYQWYYAKKGSTKFKKLSAKSATYSVKVSSSVDGRKYYCLVTDKYGQTVKSSVVTLTMQKAAKITTQPKNVSVKNGKTAKVTIKATGDGLKYTWYYLLAGETKYRKATFTGNTFSVKMAAQYKNCKVYCTIADQYGNSVKSKTVTLKMK